TTEIKSDIQVVSTVENQMKNPELFDKKNVDTTQLESEESVEETENEEVFKDVESGDEYPQILEMLNGLTADLKSIKQNTEGLSLRDNLFYERVMSIDARTTGFKNTLEKGLAEYKKTNENLKTYLTAELKTINAKEGERFNAISECLTKISSGVLDPKANFNVDENNDNSLPTPLAQPFDMKQTAYDIRDEVLNIKS